MTKQRVGPISLEEMFDSWCSNIDQTNEYYIKECMETYGFLLRVVVSKDIPPRHSAFSWIRGMGTTKFDEIFGDESVRLPTEWLLAFPERHCSLDEQRRLIYQMVKINNRDKRPMKKLDILTSSPFIISDTKSECCAIISFPKGKVTYDQDYMSM